MAAVTTVTVTVAGTVIADTIITDIQGTAVTATTVTANTAGTAATVIGADTITDTVNINRRDGLSIATSFMSPATNP